MQSDGQSRHRAAQVFLLVSLLLAAGMATVGYLYYRNFADNYRAKAEQALAAFGDLKVNELQQFRQERMGDAGILFKNAALSQLVRRAFATPPDLEAQRQLRAWLGKFDEHYQYDGVFLLDATGAERMAVPAAGRPTGAVGFQGVSKALRSGEIIFQDFYRDEQDQKIYLMLLVPILDDTDRGRALGVMALFARPPLSEATIEALGSVATEIAFGIAQKWTEDERERLVAELQTAMANVKTLSGLVPICSWCKKIRDDGNYRHHLESYISEHTNATFNHGVCPDCMAKHYPEFTHDTPDRG